MASILCCPGCFVEAGTAEVVMRRMARLSKVVVGAPWNAACDLQSLPG